MASKKEKQYGVIDVGSNSIRLSVYERSEGAYPLRKVFDEKKAVGLASYVNDGVLSSEGLRIAAKTIKRQVEHARLFGCDALSVFATAAVRNCSNSKAAIKSLTEMIGLPVDLISESREAGLGFAGIQPEIDLREGCVVDIGGGSTEFSLVGKGKITATRSLPLGSLSLWNDCVTGVVATSDEFEVCQSRVRAALLEAGADLPLSGAVFGDAAPSSTLYGIGGTIRTVMKVWAGYKALGQTGDERIETPESLTQSQVADLTSFALECPGDYGHLLVRIEPARIHTVTPGLAILSELFDWTCATRVCRSKHGIREGYVLSGYVLSHMM